MKTTPSDLDIELREQLNQVARLRLFRNSNQELEEYIGYKLQSNGIKKIQPFTAKCIFRELSHETELQLGDGWDLETILQEYKQASLFYDKYVKGRTKLHQEENLFVFLRYVYVDEYQLPQEKEFLQKLYSKMFHHKINPAILLLLMLALLPLYTSKKGDVENIKSDFSKLYSFLTRFLESDEAVYYLPMLDRLAKKSNEIYCNRIFLIYTVTSTLETYRCFSNPDDLYELNQSVQEERITFDLDDTIWVEPEIKTAPTVFWRFEQLATRNYFLYRYAMKAGNEIYYTRYEVDFSYNERDGFTVMIAYPEEISSWIKVRGKFLDISFFAYDIDDKENPRQIILNARLCGKKSAPFKKIICLQNEEMVGKLQKCLTGKQYKLHNEHPHTDYMFWVLPTAITQNAIYIPTTIHEEITEETIYYRIDKTLNEGLPSLTTNDSMGILEQDGHKYIYFEPLILSFDVSNEKICSENRIEVVERIIL